ncbi:hypothetical protein ANCCAN_06585 [Ancylostoma caninum]|uniref:SCP domain-containing protein n=1 Tax=Ancylostoma caninum TaxID=29170 RepID=A0A368GWD7_ANCCA|nr:hypothetical protein ANCCAN_06585 [Ancylostoma caninum]
MTVAAGCPSKPKLDYVPAGKSVNYAIQRGVQNKPTQDSDFETAVQDAVDKWYDYRFEDNLDTKTVLYQNEAMEPFANIIYKNTIAVGCAIIYCDTKRIATACVYNDK